MLSHGRAHVRSHGRARSRACGCAVRGARCAVRGVRVRVRACVRAPVRVRVRACVCACACTLLRMRVRACARTTLRWTTRSEPAARTCPMIHSNYESRRTYTPPPAQERAGVGRMPGFMHRDAAYTRGMTASIEWRCGAQRRGTYKIEDEEKDEAGHKGVGMGLGAEGEEARRSKRGG
eukprot:6197358-Pleurochrysis_carterae.AAC.1